MVFKTDAVSLINNGYLEERSKADFSYFIENAQVVFYMDSNCGPIPRTSS